MIVKGAAQDLRHVVKRSSTRLVKRLGVEETHVTEWWDGVLVDERAPRG
jgi:hypothetical protein